MRADVPTRYEAATRRENHTLPKVVLTDRFAATCKAENGEVQTDYFDAKTSGLALRVSSTGHKAWTLHYTSPSTGKRSRVGLGTYPSTSLAAARTAAREARAQVEAGQDPRAVLSARMSVAELVESYLEKHVRPNLRSARHVERRLRKNVLPVIGTMLASELHRRDINRVLDRMQARGCRTEANRTFEDMRAVFRWGMARGDIDRNPSDGMRAPAAEQVRDRVLNNGEIKHLWQALPEVLKKSKASQKIIKLCLITGQRVGEVAGMRRSELDLSAKTWTLPGARTKNKHQHSVPLSDLAVSIIKDAMVEGSPFIFPSGNGPHPPDAVTRTIARAQERFGLAHWSAHDLRRTALTGMAIIGVSPIILGHIANHRTTTRAGVTLAVYSKYAYDREKREALDKWAERLQAIVQGEPAKIIPLAV